MDGSIHDRIVIKAREPYAIHQPIFGHKFHRRVDQFKNRKRDGWVNAVKQVISKL